MTTASALTRRDFAAFAALAAASVSGVAATCAFAKPGGSHEESGEHGTRGKPGSDDASTASDTGEGSGHGASAATDEPNAKVVLADGDAIVGGTYEATEQDQSVFEASGDVVASIEGATIEKTAGEASSADASSFRGVNAAVRVYGNATVSLADCAVTASAEGATGVFAYDGGTIEIADSTVEVTGGGAGGVQVAGGGTLVGRDLVVTSASKAAIRSDRGGGTLDLTGGTYTSTGSNGCPAIYSTAEIVVREATCVSTSSRAVIIEGKNTVTLEDCEVSGNDQSTKEGSVHANVLLYQSASGDAAEGTSVFSMKGGTLTCENGAMLYCTNTASVVNLEAVELTLSAEGSLLVVSAGRWGKDGSNGGTCTLNATDQELTGGITVDEISSLELNLSGSTYTGAINESGDAGTVRVALDAASTWTLTGDSHVSEFDGDLACVTVTGGAHLYVGETLAL